MTVEFRVYERDNPGTLIAALAEAYNKSWYDDLVDVGSGGFTLPHNADEAAANPTLLDRHNIVRVRVDGTDRFAFLVDTVERDRNDNFDPVRVSGPGVKARLADGIVYPECWPLGDELIPDVRLFSWVSADYVEDAAWVAPTSWGTQGSRPFDDTRPEGWSDRQAELITPEAAGSQAAGSTFWRAELVVPEEMIVRFEATADDEFTFYLCGVELLRSRGAFRWNSTYSKAVRLPAGTYQVAIETVNLERASVATNVTWLLFSAMQAGGSGAPLAQQEVQHVQNDAGLNEIQQLHNDSTTGTFTITFEGETTGAIAYNATAQQVEDAMQALANIEDVEVTGSGTSADPWVIEWFDPGNENVSQITTDDTGMDGTSTITTTQQGGSGGTFTLEFGGLTTNAIDWNASASTVETELNALDTIQDVGGVTVSGNGDAGDPWVVTFNDFANFPELDADDTNLVDGTTTITTVTDGSSPDVLLRSNTTDWTMNELPATRPGMTPGEILRVLIAEAQARGALTNVTDTFTDAVDSGGTAWPDELEFAAQVGNDSILSVLQRLADYGIDFDLSPTLVLDMWAQRGTDRSGSVTLAVDDCGSRTDRSPLNVRYRQGIVNVALVRTDRGWTEYPRSGAPATDRREGFLSYGLEPAEASPAVAVGNVLDAYSTPRKQITARHAEGDGPDPYAQYDLGDTITSPTVTSPVAAAWSTAAQRVYGLGGDETDTGEIDWTTVVVAE